MTLEKFLDTVATMAGVTFVVLIGTTVALFLAILIRHLWAMLVNGTGF